MSTLFDAPLIAGLDYREEVVNEAEERELIDRLDALDLSPFRFQGWLGNRKTMSFGWLRFRRRLLQPRRADSGLAEPGTRESRDVRRA